MKYSKLTVISFFFIYAFVLFSITPSISSAQSASSNCVVTAVGNAGDTPTPRPGCSGFSGECIKPPSYPADLRQALINEFKINMDQGYDSEHLKATYEMFWCFSSTKFPSFVDDTLVDSNPNEDIHMGCPEVGPCTVWIRPMPGRMSTFTFILTHEMGHIVQYSNPRDIIHWTDMENVSAEEGGVSLYANNGLDCVGGDRNWFEDYAETIAYFLHPQAGETTPACDPDKNPPNPFFDLKKFPHHLDLAKKILLQ